MEKGGRLIAVVTFILCWPVMAAGLAPESGDSKGGGASTSEDGPFAALGSVFHRPSHPPKFFASPTAKVLQTLEVSLSAGSSFGERQGTGFLSRIGLGLGGVAEIEFSSTQVANELTGRENRFPARTFKVNLIPDRWQDFPLMPLLAVQLRATSWGAAVERNDALSPGLREKFSDVNQGWQLQSIGLQSRWTTFHFIAGKTGELGGIHGGITLTDVRTKKGHQWYLEDEGPAIHTIPAQQKNLVAPFGGIMLNANSNTQLLAEVSQVPKLEYDVVKRAIEIRSTWAGVAGVRFFIGDWLSWDTGVRYLSTYDGIADAEINMALNVVLAFNNLGRGE